MSSTVDFSQINSISSFLHHQTLAAKLIEAQWQVTVSENRLNQAQEKMAKFAVESKSITDQVRVILNSYDAGTCSDSQWKRGNGHMLRLTGLLPESEKIQKEIGEFSAALERAKEKCMEISKQLNPNGLLVAEQNVNGISTLVLLNIPNNNNATLTQNSTIINHTENQNSVHSNSNSNSSADVSPIQGKRAQVIQVMKTSPSSDNTLDVDRSKKQKTRNS